MIRRIVGVTAESDQLKQVLKGISKLHDAALGENRMQLLQVVANVFPNRVLRNEYKFVFSHNSASTVRQSNWIEVRHQQQEDRRHRRHLSDIEKEELVHEFVLEQCTPLAESMIKKTVHIETQPNTSTEKYARRCAVKALYQKFHSDARNDAEREISEDKFRKLFPNFVVKAKQRTGMCEICDMGKRCQKSCDDPAIREKQEQVIKAHLERKEAQSTFVSDNNLVRKSD
jgi:hypothetical protein